MGFQAFFGGHDTETLISESMVSSFNMFASLTDALIDGGKLDPNDVLKQLGPEQFVRTELPVSETLAFFMRRRMNDRIRQERNRFRRIKTKAKKRGMVVERNVDVLSYVNTGREYLIKE